MIGALHGAARKAFLLAAAGLAALPLVLLVLGAALAVEFQLMLHTMVTLLDDGTGNQPITLLALASLIAIVALHVLTRQPGSEAIHRWMMRLGLVALVLFLLGFGLIVAMTSFEVAASMLFDPATGIDGLDSWLADADGAPDDESFVEFLRDLFADYGGLIALLFATLGLGGVFFLTVLVSHFLIGVALKLAGDFVGALIPLKESGKHKAEIFEADAALGEIAHDLKDHDAQSPAAQVGEAVAILSAKADRALSYPRRVAQAEKLMKADDAGDLLAGLGSKLLGLPDEVGTLDVPALKALLADLEQAISDDVLFDIAVSVAITEFGLTENDLEMFDD
ncbi:hypothetical protein [Erythrobacter sp. HL-111]|uniref:hypothetical protein n=1 Tax=Erythrobacter sp. HL-111 TaxID=1798193 RepID=UPI0008795B2F|nr:hypothetical protein [Erythrobacter sp. HL-111]SDR67653.1 hypothetical protein SAMN04515621_0016 [Erythrobacter sp. HL-111]